MSLLRMAIKNTDPPELIRAKLEYGDGVWEPQLKLGRPNNRGDQKILGVTSRNRKFWPYKKWLLIDGKWVPSIEMPD